MKTLQGPFGRVVELGVALGALVTSGVSIWLSLQQGDDMARLVQAQSWPYLELESSNTGDDGPQIDLAVRNVGVGPAKIRTFAVVFDRKPMRGWAELLRTCCAPEAMPIDSGPALVKATDGKVLSTQILRRVLRASDQVSMLRIAKSDANQPLWDKLDGARFKLAFRACYCSVFDECWVSDLRGGDQRRVDACPLEPTPYVQ